MSSLLGSGGMAAVFAATDLRGRHAALKVLHAELLPDSSARERFEREAWVARTVQHPCLVTVFDEGTTEVGEPFLVMEQLHGSTVERLWKRAKKRLPVPVVLRVAERTLDLISTCHRVGVIHRDLKPANLYITHAGDVKVLDFGIASIRDVADLPEGVAVGTPSFMSPEQAAGAWTQVDQTTDIFAVGATMYTLLSGARLHEGDSERAGFELAATVPAPSLASVVPAASPALIALVDRALAWDKNARWPDAEAMREEVIRLLDEVDDGTSTLTGAMSKDLERASLVTGGHRPTVPPTVSRRPPSEAGRLPSRIPPPPGLPQGLEAVPPGESHQKTLRSLMEAFQMLERLLGDLGQDGFTSGSFRERLSATHALLSRAIRSSGGPIRLGLFPFCVTWESDTIWEPEPPLDAVAHALFAAGIRAIRLHPGLASEDLRRLVEMLTDSTAS
ncbi:MAG TPA: serine/threonine-protein kinase, partial [Polyangiaceae bacterium]|nr:serine/threonine-protein kinase [Polyangiaceae bacterium]